MLINMREMEFCFRALNLFSKEIHNKTVFPLLRLLNRVFLKSNLRVTMIFAVITKM